MPVVVDCKHLTSIFLVTQIKFTGGLTQCKGRILRTAQGKDTATVYDYVDSNIGVLAASFKSRLWAYKNL